MKLHDILNLPSPPAPWSEGEKIPWHDPAFSRRMLAEHLTAEHDLASRRPETVDRHVAWIDGLLERRPSRILDLGCGPGLYTSRLARRGHECVGIDFGPASIEHARAEAEREELACEYRLEDLRAAGFGAGFDLVMLIYGELTTFPAETARELLTKARAALAPGGLLLLELHPFDLVERHGRRGRAWSVHPSGLFSDRPHLLLEEAFWDGEAKVATTRWVVTDLETGEATLHAESLQARTEEEIRTLLGECGFAEVRTAPSLTGEAPGEDTLVAWYARK